MAVNVADLKKSLIKAEEANLSKYKKIGLIYNWIGDSDTHVDDVKAFIELVFPMLGSDLLKASVVSEILSKKNTLCPLNVMLQDIFPACSSDMHVLLLGDWLGFPQNEDEANAKVLPILEEMFPDDADQAILIAGWSRNPDHDMSEDTFKKICKRMFQKKYTDNVREIARNFFDATLVSYASNPNDQEHVKKLLVAIALIRDLQPENKSVLQSWGRNEHNTLTSQDFIMALKKLDHEEDKYILAMSWFSKNEQQDLQVLLEALPLLKNPKHQSEVATVVISPLLKDGSMMLPVKIKSLLEILPYIESADNIFSYIHSWCMSTGMKTSALSDEDFIKLLSLIKIVNKKFDIAIMFLENRDGIISIDTLKAMVIQFGNVKSTYCAYCWIMRPENIGNADALSFGLGVGALLNKQELIKTWILRSNETINTQEIIKRVATAQIPDITKKDIFKTLISEAGENNSADCLITILNAIEDKSESCQFSYVEMWLNVSNVTTVNADEFLKIITFIKSKSLLDNIISVWVNKAKSYNAAISGSIDSLLKIISHIQTDDSMKDIAIKWISDEKSQSTADNIVSILKLMNVEFYKNIVITWWLSKESDQAKRFQQFLDLIDAKVLGSLYTDSGISNIRLAFNRNFDIHFTVDKLPDLCRHLYPNIEHMQATFFEEAIRHDQMYSNLYAATLDPAGSSRTMCNLIITFAKSLHEPDPCLQVLALGEPYSIKPTDILEVANDRLASRYSSLVQVLNQPLLPALNTEGLESVKEIFGELPPDTKLSALFAYANIYDEITGLFVNNVKPDIMEQIKRDYKPSVSSPYITTDEYSALIQTFDVEPLPRVASLCDYLQSNISPISPIGRTTLLLKFAVVIKGLKAQESDDEIKYKKKFIELLAIMDKEISEEDEMNAVGEFFDFITDTKKGAQEQDKLYELMTALKKEFVYLFTETNGISNYLAVLAGLDDGCVANITMKTKMYIYGKLIDPKGENKQNALLYLYLCDHIALPFFKTADHLGASAAGASADVFENPSLRALHISMPGLLAGLASEFYSITEVPPTLNQAKPTINPYLYISALATEDECFELYEHLGEAFPKHMQTVEDTHGFYQQEAKIASFLIIRKSMPELLNSPYLAELKKDCEKWLGPDFKPEESNVSSRGNKI